eukprot:scaffold1423_cov39-Attheya_sp.AAC.1
MKTDDLLSRLEDLMPSKWGLHETYLCQELYMKATETTSVRTQLGELLTAMRNGGSGNKRQNSWKKTGYNLMDLSDTSIPNDLDIHYQIHGDKESFAADSLNELSSFKHRPRYFIIGGFKASEKGNQKFDHIKTQCLIMKLATGETFKGMEVFEGFDKESQQRRQANWLAWYQNIGDKAKDYKQKDLPILAIQFEEFFDVIIPKQGKIPSRILASVAKEIREILRCCNRIPRKTRQGTTSPFHNQQQLVPSKIVSPPTNKRQRQQENETAVESLPKKQCEMKSPRGLPDSLTLKVLRNLISSDNVGELAAIEFAVHLFSFTQKETRQHEKVSITVAVDSFKNAGVPKPISISLEDLHGLPIMLHASVVRNVGMARKELLARLPGELFCPKCSDMLHTWRTDGKRYTDGIRLPAANYEIHPKSNRLWLTDKAAHFMRHIVYCFKVPLSRFPCLMNNFAILLLGRPLTLPEFSSASTLRSRFTRLYQIERHRFSVKFETHITALIMKNFHQLWYMVSDDSKHHDRSRHVCLMTAHREEEKDKSDMNDSPNPCFRLMTASVAGSKDSSGNAALNVSAASETLPNSVCALYGGAVTDNAADALSESNKTFDLFMGANVGMEKMYGVVRRPIINGDMYHIDNLMCMHTSNDAFGETDRGVHSQVHHRQLLQSIHDIHKNDRNASQRAMDTVLLGTNNTLKVRTTRERQQRWLVNQRQASFVISGQTIMTTDGVPALLAWALYMYEHSDSWVKRASMEV